MKSSQTPFRLRENIRLISPAVALTLLSFSSYAQDNSAVSLRAVNVTGKTPVTLLPTEAAPSQASLNATSAQSTVSDTFIRNFVSPVADYTQVLSTTPGAFSFTPNGVGLGDTKVIMRGLSDSNSVISFDGIPFNDTNGVSHHSWAFFPALFLGGATVDRSPGSAATVGQATYGGSFDLRSRVLSEEKRTDITYSTGTWNTRMLNLEHTTGKFGEQGENNLLFNVHEMKSDGYQTYNQQDRKGFSAKYERVVSPDTKVTAFMSYMDLKNNTPNIKGISRTDYNNGVYNNLLSGDSTKANYYGYNFYDLPSDFSYVGIQTQLENGWKLEDKFYRYSYHNKQNYNNSTTHGVWLHHMVLVNGCNTSQRIFAAGNERTVSTMPAAGSPPSTSARANPRSAACCACCSSPNTPGRKAVMSIAARARARPRRLRDPGRNQPA